MLNLERLCAAGELAAVGAAGLSWDSGFEPAWA
jgi:hypothetical protein